MTVPDPAFYASLPAIGGMIVWIARQFVIANAKSSSGEFESIAPSLTVRGYKEIAELLTKELNGRYMLAGEARDKFKELGSKIDILAERLHPHRN